MITFLTMSLALAAEPVGYRSDVFGPTSHATVRTALAMTTQDGFVSHSVLHGQFALAGVFALDVQMPLVGGWTSDWRRAGYGPIRLGAQAWFGARGWSGAAGVDFAVPHSYTRYVAAWATNSHESLPDTELSLRFEAAGEYWALATTLGLGSGLWEGNVVASPRGSALLVLQFPLIDQFVAVAEAEAIVDPSPFALRGLIRHERKALHLDLGVQIPLMEYVTGPRSFTALAAVRVFDTKYATGARSWRPRRGKPKGP